MFARNWQWGTSFIGGNLLKTELNFDFVRLVSLKSVLSLKWNKRLDKLRKVVRIMKSSVKMEYPFGIVIKANGGITVLGYV